MPCHFNHLKSKKHSTLPGGQSHGEPPMESSVPAVTEPVSPGAGVDDKTPEDGQKTHEKDFHHCHHHILCSLCCCLETYVDIATILGTTATAAFIYALKSPASRSFAVTTNNGDVVYPEFALPLRREIVPAWLSIILGPVLPVICILILQLRIRSFWDANNAVFGVLYSLVNSVIFQVIVKWLIGGLRPHFLDVCKPDLSLAKNKSGYNAVGFKSMYYTRDICTGDAWEINDSLSSFPSGHTTAAFAGFVFLSLYMNAKFKIFANRHTPLWKLLMFYAPILFSTLVGGALTIDAYHNWYDIVAGAVIGTVSAVSAFRTTYAAVFDWRYNHIPLNRNKFFDYEAIDPSQSRVRHFGLSHLDNSRLRENSKETKNKDKGKDSVVSKTQVPPAT